MEMDIDDQVLFDAAQQLDEAKKEYLKPIVSYCFTHPTSPYSFKLKENIPDVEICYIIEELIKKYLQPEDPTKTLVQEFEKGGHDASFWENRGISLQNIVISVLEKKYRECVTRIAQKLTDDLATELIQKNSSSEANTDLTEDDLKLLILLEIVKPMTAPYTKLLEHNLHPAIKVRIFYYTFLASRSRGSEAQVEDWKPTYAKESNLFKLSFAVVSNAIDGLEGYEWKMKKELFSIACSVLCNCEDYSVFVAKDAFTVFHKIVMSVDNISELVANYGHKEEILKILCDEFDPETKLNKSVKDKDIVKDYEDNDMHAERLESHLCGQIAAKFESIKDPELLLEELKDINSIFQK